MSGSSLNFLMKRPVDPIFHFPDEPAFAGPDAAACHGRARRPCRSGSGTCAGG
jgi:hypothetical protein